MASGFEPGEQVRIHAFIKTRGLQDDHSRRHRCAAPTGNRLGKPFVNAVQPDEIGRVRQQRHGAGGRETGFLVG